MYSYSDDENEAISEEYALKKAKDQIVWNKVIKKKIQKVNMLLYVWNNEVYLRTLDKCSWAIYAHKL